MYSPYFYEQIRDFLVTDTVKNLYLIRHGETYFNLEDRIGGNSDLTENGWKQAEALAEFFKKRRIPLILQKTAHSTMAIPKRSRMIAASSP